MKTIIKPENMKYIWITYKIDNTNYTQRGFYSEIFNNISIPQQWGIFNNYLLPKGFNSRTILLDDVIKWEYCTDWK
jgi:hypothetical protein